MIRRSAFRPSFLMAAVVVVLGAFGAAAIAATTGGGMHKAGPSEAVAFAMVRGDGTIDPAFTSNNISNAMLLTISATRT